MNGQQDQQRDDNEENRTALQMAIWSPRLKHSQSHEPQTPEQAVLENSALFDENFDDSERELVSLHKITELRTKKFEVDMNSLKGLDAELVEDLHKKLALVQEVAKAKAEVWLSRSICIYTQVKAL